MKIQLIGAVSAIVLVAMASTAGATVVEIGSFTGEMYEGFESIGSIGAHPGPYSILEGGATFSDTLAGTLMIANSLYSGITSTAIYPYNGNLMGGSVTGWADLVFDPPITKFGGYLGTADNLTGGSVTFWDEWGGLQDQVSLQLTLGEWGWYGWESDVPIGHIQIKAAANPGLGLTFDDLQASVVPEPTSLGLIAVGTAALFARKRRVAR